MAYIINFYYEIIYSILINLIKTDETVMQIHCDNAYYIKVHYIPHFDNI